MSKSPRHYKLVAVGDGAVGKTCLLITFSKNEFPEKYIPTVFDNSTALISVDEETFELELWDTAGQEDYDRLRPLSYRDAHMVFIFYSVVDPDSFRAVETKWITEVRKHVQCPVMLIATKVDLRRPDSITTEQGKEMATKIGAALYMETSAKTRMNVNEAFQEAVRCIRGPIEKGCCVML